MPVRHDGETISQEYRDKASRFAEHRSECYRLSKDYYESGNKAMAKEYSLKAKRFQLEVDQMNELAAATIFDFHNQNRPSNIIDLHGLRKNEAIEKLQERINQGNGNGLTVITGQGIHSNDGISILKPAVIKFAKRNRIRYKENVPNPGCIRFESAHIVDIQRRDQQTDQHTDESPSSYKTLAIIVFVVIALLFLAPIFSQR